MRAGSSVAIGQIAAATGLGGIGKSQLAVEFVYRYGRFFVGGVYWLSFTDPIDVFTEVAACGDFPNLPLSEQAAIVQRRWQDATPRLLVYDNCEAEELLDKWRPATGGCRVLVTSRRSSWDPVLGVSALALGVLPRAESVAFLRKFCLDLPADDLDLHALAEELGNLPLALHLHRYRHSITLAAYRDDLRRVDVVHHTSLQSGSISPTGHEQHVARTFPSVSSGWTRTTLQMPLPWLSSIGPPALRRGSRFRVDCCSLLFKSWKGVKKSWGRVEKGRQKSH